MPVKLQKNHCVTTAGGIVLPMAQHRVPCITKLTLVAAGNSPLIIHT